MRRPKLVVVTSPQQAAQCADTEARWLEMKLMMRGPRWQRIELARRFHEAYADEVAG